VIPGKYVGRALKTSGGLYRLKAHLLLSKEYANFASSSTHVDINVLHHRLGHLRHDNVKRLVAKSMVEGVKPVGGRVELCEACIHGNIHRFPFPPSNKIACRKLELVHSDVYGPLPMSMDGKHYFILFIDDHTHHVWLYTMAKKSETISKLKKWKALVENQSGNTIKKIHTDNGTEYTLLEFEGYLKSFGIIHELTATYSLQQNGLSEVENQIEAERICSMLYDSNLPVGF